MIDVPNLDRIQRLSIIRGNKVGRNAIPPYFYLDFLRRYFSSTNLAPA